VERLKGDVGATVTLDKVLFVSGERDAKAGTPAVSNASVTAQIVEQGRAKTIIVFKKKRRKNYRRTKGHRQCFTKIRITGISGI
jgi:large subunit ribosomal protein L21